MSADAPVTLHGADDSVYARIARLALIEKGVPHRFETVDIFAAGGPPEGYSRLHRFGKIPALEHGDFRLYETGAITRYVDEAFAGPPLQPAEPQARARMSQIIGIIDSYAYRPMVWDIAVERLFVPERGGSPDEAKIAEAVQKSEHALDALAALAEGPFLLGSRLSLADLQLYPVIAYLGLTPEGASLLQKRPRIASWTEIMAGRASVRETRYPTETPGTGEAPAASSR